MNTPNQPDPLDRKLDELLASQPLKPSIGFTDRVLAATDKPDIHKSPSRTIHPWLRMALPIAALLAVAFTLAQLISTQPAEAKSAELTTIELQEIFLLEEGLTGLAGFTDEDLSNTDLFDALIFFNSDT